LAKKCVTVLRLGKKRRRDLGTERAGESGAEVDEGSKSQAEQALLYERNVIPQRLRVQGKLLVKIACAWPLMGDHSHT
jgi:hypothetical protein